MQHQRRRPLSRRPRNSLAPTLEEIVEVIAHTPKSQARGGRPLFLPAVVARVSDDLRLLLRALRADEPSARSIANAERIMSDGRSPLYGDDSEPGLGVLLPCNVIVYQQDAQTHIAAVDAERMLSIVGNDELGTTASEVRQRLAAVVNRAAQG